MFISDLRQSVGFSGDIMYQWLAAVGGFLRGYNVSVTYGRSVGFFGDIICEWFTTGFLRVLRFLQQFIKPASRDIYWILHVKICITCRINPRTLYHHEGHRPEGWYRSRLIRHVIQILTCNVHYIIYFNHAFDNTCI